MLTPEQMAALPYESFDPFGPDAELAAMLAAAGVPEGTYERWLIDRHQPHVQALIHDALGLPIIRPDASESA